VTRRTDLSRKAMVAWLRLGTVVLRAVATVGADFIGAAAIVIEFRLLENVTPATVCWRAQPSGTLIKAWIAGARYATYTVASGMSPGGLCSAETGACDLTIAGCLEAVDDFFAPGVVAGWLPVELALAQPARIATMAEAAVGAITRDSRPRGGIVRLLAMPKV